MEKNIVEKAIDIILKFDKKVVKRKEALALCERSATISSFFNPLW